MQQGDIIEHVPIFQPKTLETEWPQPHAVFDWEERDIVILTQSCDLVKGREKTNTVLACAVWTQSDLEAHSSQLVTPRSLEDLRRGNLPAFHMLAACDIPDMVRDLRIVAFQTPVSLPVAFARSMAEIDPDRLRVLPPYREHLSQAFARYFMRVGLPLDIPPFR